MADTQTAPQAPAGLQPIPALGGSIDEAQEALLSILEPEEETPESEEAQPTEDVESTEETQDESLKEEPEEEEEAEEAEEESEEPDEEAEEELLYAVKVDGAEQEVTLDELMKGYSRQSDYTKKTQELAAGRKVIEDAYNQYNSEIVALQQERQQYIAALSQVVQHSLSGIEQYNNIDWETLKQEDPIEYFSKRDELQQRQAQLAANQQQMEQAQYQQNAQAQSQREDRQQKFANYHMTQLAEKLPEWKDPDQKTKIWNEAREFAVSQGYAESEFDSLLDHRHLLILLKAKKYDDLQGNDISSKKVKNKPKVVRAGSPRESKASDKKKRTAQMKRLKGTGHIDDASALLEDFIDI